MSTIPQNTLIITLDCKGHLNRAATTGIGPFTAEDKRIVEKERHNNLDSWGRAIMHKFMMGRGNLDAVYFEMPGAPLVEIRGAGMVHLPTGRCHNIA